MSLNDLISNSKLLTQLLSSYIWQKFLVNNNNNNNDNNNNENSNNDDDDNNNTS